MPQLQQTCHLHRRKALANLPALWLQAMICEPFRRCQNAAHLLASPFFLTVC